MKPIIVTGLHRTGTTALGKHINQSLNSIYVWEPSNPLNKNFGLPGFPASKPSGWYLSPTIISDIDDYTAFLSTSTRCDLLIPSLCSSFKALTVANPLKLMRDLQPLFFSGPLLIKDPFVSFIVNQIQDFSLHIFVTIRSPYSFIESLLSKHWYFDFKEFYGRQMTVDQEFPYENYFRLSLSTRKNLIINAALLWKYFYDFISTIDTDNNITLVKQECLHEMATQRAILDTLLHHNCVPRSKILKHIFAHANSFTGSTKGYNPALSLNRWQHSMTPDELNLILRIVQLTHNEYLESIF